MRLFSTKLRTPAAPRGSVIRRRLQEELTRGAARRLVLVCAPAGFGKTTALAQWARNSRGTVAWLSLDADDRDPIRFLAYLAAGLSRVSASLGDLVLAAAAAPRLPATHSLLARVVAVLEDFPGEVHICLDDYHLVASSPVDDLLVFLLERLPPRAHLLVSTRSEPPWPLARMRALGDVAELGADELSFSREEAGRFLTDREGLKLSRGDVAELERRTEGWITGLRLAAVSLREHAEPARFIESFNGGHRHVFDYLAEEVLGRQREEVRSFLLETSLLSRLNDSLCESVTSSSGAGRVLRELEREHLFLEPLDDSRGWFRYHHLFGEFLRRALRNERSESSIASFHQRAAAWYAEHELELEAVAHHLAAGDGVGAADVVERALPRLGSRSDTYAEAVDLLTRLPEDAIRSRPRLSLELAWAVTVSNRPGDPELLLASAAARLRADPLPTSLRRELRGVASTIRAARAASRGRADECERHGRRALALLPRDQLRWRATVNVGLGLARLAAGRPRAAELALREALERSRDDADRAKTLWSLEGLGRSLEHQGKLEMAASVFREGVQATKQLGSLRATWQGAVGAASYVGLARILYERNDLAGAEDVAREALALAEGCEMPDVQADVVVPGYLLLARVHGARKNGDASEEALARAGREAARLGRWPLGDEVESVRVGLWLSRDDVAAAREWLDELEGRVGDPIESSPELRLAASRVIIEDARRRPGRLAETMRWLEGWRFRCETNGSIHRVIAARLLEARAHRARGETDRAEEAVRRAVESARTGGHVRMFLDDGPPLTLLLTRVLQRLGRHGSAADAEHVIRVLRAAGVEIRLESSRRGEGESAEVAVEPLSEREIQVLETVDAGLSNRGIAETLGISVGTVKRHLSNIYGKLCVRSRTAAIAKARRLRWLDERGRE